MKFRDVSVTNPLVQVLANATQTSQHVTSKRSALLKGRAVLTEPYPTRGNVRQGLRYLRALHARRLLQRQRTTQWSLTEHAERGPALLGGVGGTGSARDEADPARGSGRCNRWRPGRGALRTAALGGAGMRCGVQLQPARVPPGK